MDPQRPHALLIASVIGPFLAVAVGCSDPPATPPAERPVAVRSSGEPAAAASSGPAQPGPAPSGPVQTRKTIGKTTQIVLDLADAKAQGGVPIDAATEAEEGGLGAYSQAARHSVATIGGLAVEQKMKLHRAEHGSLPATHREFMTKIIAAGTPDAVSLPMLPYYQEYAFDPGSRRLVVVEFPARKEQRRRETTGPLGL